ncbi:MAG TPA: GGIII-like transmembrane region-containing protein [Chitinophagaceae bacterium]|nr:GGIII-like transmembrane region-containing protein [Chitinophagaceae bacterium]
MTKRIFYNTTVTLVFLCLTLCASAQAKTTVKATVDKSKILIGEPIVLRVEADIPNDEPIRFFDLDSLPHFEFLSRQKIDTSNTNSGTVLSQVMQITSFDSGHWVIPAFVVGEAASDTIPIDVGFSAFDPEQPYHEIKDIIEVAPEKKKEDRTWWWYIAGGGVLLIIVLILLLTRKKKPVVKPPPPPVDPYQKALKQLNKLQETKPEVKEYYSSLTDIFRVYVSERKGIHSLQKTTDDLVNQLKGLGIEKELFDRLAAALRLSDLVKFAKYETVPAEDKASADSVKRSIEQIEELHRPAPVVQENNLQRK